VCVVIANVSNWESEIAQKLIVRFAFCEKKTLLNGEQKVETDVSLVERVKTIRSIKQHPSRKLIRKFTAINAYSSIF
jgi:hypothetical protein